MATPVERIAAAFEAMAVAHTHAANHLEKIHDLLDRTFDNSGMSKSDAQLWSEAIQRAKSDEDLRDVSSRLGKTLRNSYDSKSGFKIEFTDLDCDMKETFRSILDSTDRSKKEGA